MKKTILLAVIALVSTFAYAQDAKYIYAELVGTGKLFSNKVTVEIDYGQATSVWKNDSRLLGEDGKPIKFNSMVDAMNFMGNQGWEFAQAYVVSTSNQSVYHWLLKRDVSTLSAAEKDALLKSYTTKPE